MTHDVNTWITELTALVRLYGQDRADVNDVLGLATHVWTTEGDVSEPQGRFIIRQLLNVAGQATVDEDHVVFASARKLITDEFPAEDRQALSADEILNAFANVGQSAVAVRAVRDSYRRYFGT